MPWGGSWEVGAVVVASAVKVTAGDPGIDTAAAGSLNLGSTNATAVNIDPPTTIDNTLVANSLQLVAGDPGLDTTAAGVLALGAANATQIDVDPDLAFSSHLISNAPGTPATSALNANVTSATYTGNDTRGKIVIVIAAGGLAANTSAFTTTFAVTYGATPPVIILVDQTSTSGLAIVNSYIVSQSTGVSFIIAFDQALVAGTYTIQYLVVG